MTTMHTAGDASDAGSARDDPDFVQSLARGLAVITAFSHERPAMTLTGSGFLVSARYVSASSSVKSLWRIFSSTPEAVAMNPTEYWSILSRSVS